MVGLRALRADGLSGRGAELMLIDRRWPVVGELMGQPLTFDVNVRDGRDEPVRVPLPAW